MVREIAVGGDAFVTVTVALTVAGCPLQKQLRSDIDGKVGAVPGVSGVAVRMGEMDAAEKSALMARARAKAQDRGIMTDIPATTRILAVASGKGGVGKSSVTANLAVSLALRGLIVGVLDADIWGFSLPRMLGVEGQVVGEDRKMVPIEQPVGDGLLKVLSMGPHRRGGRGPGDHVARAHPQPRRPALPGGRALGRARLPPHRHASRDR
jgi:ATP-binding protein involved in chromosome partitioning